MINCNKCGNEIIKGNHYFELMVTAKQLGKPIPFFFAYCSQTCMFDDMIIKIRIEEKKEND